MAKYYSNGKLNPINHLMRVNGLTPIALAKVLNVTQTTVRTYINNPFMMTGLQYSSLAGLFGIKIEVLIYLLFRNKTQIRPKDKVDKWYIEDVRLEGEKILASFPRENFGDVAQNP